MTVIAFPVNRTDPTTWQSKELQPLTELCGATVADGTASGWSTGKTERGDPQLYLVGPQPDYGCILCVSRLGTLYVLEDGGGRVLGEHNSMTLLAEQARGFLKRKRHAIVTRLALVWCAARECIEEKLEPVTAESAEFMAHVVPQLAAFA